MSETVSSEGSELLELLGYAYVQQILAATSDEPKSAKELSQLLNADLSTVYRHVENMVEQNLLVEGTELVEDGSHHSVYEANVDHVAIDVGNGELTVDISVRESPAKRFTRMWDDIRDT